MSRRTTGGASKPTEMDNVENILGKRKRAPSGLLDDSSAMHQDFEDYGYTRTEIEELLSIEETAVDSHAQIAHGRYARQRKESEQRFEEFMKKHAKREARRAIAGVKKGYVEVVDGLYGNGVKTRQQIFLDGLKKWVLFDPIHGWPPTMISEPPAAYERFSQYMPGNLKVVAFNTESYAITLRKTPDWLKGLSVDYSKTGPKAGKIKRDAS